MRISLRFAGLAAALALMAGPSIAQTPSAIDPEKLKAAFPEAWEGYERSALEFEPPIAGLGGNGSVSARYRDKRGGTNFFEASLNLSDMGISGGKMYADYGADYLKGPVENDTQKSVTVKGLPGLLTMTGEDHMMVETFVAPRLGVRASCMNAKPEECVAALERFDFEALGKLVADAP